MSQGGQGWSIRSTSRSGVRLTPKVWASSRSESRARLHHVNLKAYHFEEMRAFYTALIGIHPVAEVGTFGWYTFDTANHRLALMHLPMISERVSGSAGMHHMAFEYDRLDDLMRTYLRLKKISVVPAVGKSFKLSTLLSQLKKLAN